MQYEYALAFGVDVKLSTICKYLVSLALLSILAHIITKIILYL